MAYAVESMVMLAEAVPFAPLSSTTLGEFNAGSAEAAEEQLLGLCGSRRWAATLSARRPFANGEALRHQATNLWFLLDETDWLEAFRCHPRIGEQAGVGAGAGHANAEQAVARESLSGVPEGALAEGNRRYEARFGFLYLVFASGRTAAELLALLEERLERDRVTELHEAARQQHEITMLRMSRWLEG